MLTPGSPRLLHLFKKKKKAEVILLLKELFSGIYIFVTVLWPQSAQEKLTKLVILCFKRSS